MLVFVAIYAFTYCHHLDRATSPLSLYSSVYCYHLDRAKSHYNIKYSSFIVIIWIGLRPHYHCIHLVYCYHLDRATSPLSLYSSVDVYTSVHLVPTFILFILYFVIMWIGLWPFYHFNMIGICPWLTFYSHVCMYTVIIWMLLCVTKTHHIIWTDEVQITSYVYIIHLEAMAIKVSKIFALLRAIAFVYHLSSGYMVVTLLPFTKKS